MEFLIAFVLAVLLVGAVLGGIALGNWLADEALGKHGR